MYVRKFLAKTCHVELEWLLEPPHCRHDCQSLTLGKRKSNVVVKEIAPASETPATILVASTSNRLSSEGSRLGGAMA